MEPKTCTSCRCPHFEDYDLCEFCADQLQYELEQRLQDEDGAVSLMTVASWAMFGLPKDQWRD